MTRSMTLPVSTYSVTELALWCWLAFGAVVLALIPQARGMHDVVGWLPFWLVVAPLLDLAVVHRSRLLSTSQTLLVRARRRRHRFGASAPKQARRTQRRRAVSSLGASAPRMA